MVYLEEKIAVMGPRFWSVTERISLFLSPKSQEQGSPVRFWYVQMVCGNGNVSVNVWILISPGRNICSQVGGRYWDCITEPTVPERLCTADFFVSLQQETSGGCEKIKKFSPDPHKAGLHALGMGLVRPLSPQLRPEKLRLSCGVSKIAEVVSSHST